ncbi:MAG: AAA family ATPase [Bacteroidia bacterium]
MRNPLDRIVIAGINGCGKTTILETIKDFYNQTLQEKGENAHFCFVTKATERERLLEAEEDLKKVTNWNTLDSKMAEIKQQRYITFVSEKYKMDKTNPLENFPSFCKNIQSEHHKLYYLPIFPQTESSEFVKILHLTHSFSEMKEEMLKKIRAEIFKRLDVPPREVLEKAVKEINELLVEFELSSRLVNIESEEFIFESITGEKVLFEALSHGEQNLYFRAMYFHTLAPQNSILMIDEPEQALHPRWQQKILNFYHKVGKNNQVILATHSPHIIASAKPEEVFFLELENQEIVVKHPSYTQGHSIDYVLEAMGANPRDTKVIALVDAYLALIRKGEHLTEAALALKQEIDALHLDKNSDELRRIDLAIRRFKVIGK